MMALHKNKTLTGFACGVAAAVVIGGGGIAIAAIPATGSGVITSCVNARTSVVRIIDYQARRRCVRGERMVTWNSKGVSGPTGATGATGPAGQPDYSLVYDKTAADARFLPKTGKAADADTVDGVDSSGLARGGVTTQTVAVDAATGTLMSVPGWANVTVLNCNASFANAAINNLTGGTTSLWVELSTLPAGSSAGTNWVSAGSPSTTAGAWARWTVAKVGVGVLVMDLRSRWNGTSCSFAITATYPTTG
jgi:hypothetical protein